MMMAAELQTQKIEAALHNLNQTMMRSIGHLRAVPFDYRTGEDSKLDCKAKYNQRCKNHPCHAACPRCNFQWQYYRLCQELGLPRPLSRQILMAYQTIGQGKSPNEITLGGLEQKHRDEKGPIYDLFFPESQ
jgi:hypothetical protein